MKSGKPLRALSVPLVAVKMINEVQEVFDFVLVLPKVNWESFVSARI
jgi:hypothetical protein